MSKVPVRFCRQHASAQVPVYMSEGAAGCDVFACVEAPITIAPGARYAIPTGLSVEIPSGYEIQVRPRSGLALKKGLTVVNAPGTIDSDYRGEVKILVINLGQEPVEVVHGDRVAQFVVQRVEQIEWIAQEALSETARGVGGFGSTGVTQAQPT
ncbi:dUTP diphosphatase [bacterium]|nr:dUTP diphosphatase [bacterium]